MAREFKGRLSADDIAWLRQRYPESYVQRMVDLHGTAKGADSEDAQAKAAAEAAEAQAKADAEAQAEAERLQREQDEAAAEAARAAEEDLIGDSGGDGDAGAGDGSYDVLGATESEVKTWAATASDEDKAAALSTEQARTDREPRKGVVSLLS